MLAVAEATCATWVACSGSDVDGDFNLDPTVRQRTPLPFSIRCAPTSPTEYAAHYGVISNPLLWFVQHYLWALAYEPLIDDAIHRAWHDGYLRVNQRVADLIVDTALRSRKQPLVLFQDYHLYLSPRLVRNRLPDIALQHFVHIPWPTPQYWTVLPHEIRDAILDGLLANDVIGFQTNRDVRNFLSSCQELMGLRIDEREAAVLHRGRVTWVKAYPVSVDVDEMQSLSSSREVAAEVALLERWRPERLIVRIDRTDPIKNVVRGFLAYERLLRDHPELVGAVQFWAFLQPSRQDVKVYRDYLARVRSTAARINDELGRPGWVPIRLEFKESLKRAAAAYKSFDVLLVNSIYDGMNLVAKEGMLLNERDGVLVLSENAGAHEQLGRHAISVNPFDIRATADAMYLGLMMPLAERRTRASAIREHVAGEDIQTWLRRQLDDLRELAPRPGLRAPVVERQVLRLDQINRVAEATRR